MWHNGWRDQVWDQLNRHWDLVIIGGGITGAGILREASQAGLSVLLLDANDFAFGTSSRSSKLVHGGFRYLRNRQFNVTSESVKERERLLREAENLVTPLQCIISLHEGDRTPAWEFGLGVVVYDLMALKWQHGHYSPKKLSEVSPQLSQKGLKGGYYYYDGLTDDARLVVRLIREAVQGGGVALNYARVETLLRDQDGQVCGVAVQDRDPAGAGRTREVHAAVVINASGPWADTIREPLGAEPILRKQRGSHLIFPWAKFPIDQAFTLTHPWDNRVLFAIPWEGVTMVGTTDLDHPAELEKSQLEPTITRDEVSYLMAAVDHSFPDLGLKVNDVRSTFSGLRPIVNTGKADPSKESRAHVILEEDGLLTITGGKLTTYRIMAHQVLEAARPRFAFSPGFNTTKPTFNDPPDVVEADVDVTEETLSRLVGRYGRDALALLAAAGTDELGVIDELPSLWAELRWAAREEGVVHLDDLLLRRVRLGLLADRGGLDEIERIRAIVQPELGWSDDHWAEEVAAYQKIWQQCYFLPEE